MTVLKISIHCSMPKKRRWSYHARMLLLGCAVCGVGSQYGYAASAQSAPGEDLKAPNFVLLGTTRIGDRYSAMLRHRDGSSVLVVSEGGSEAVIEDYPDFLVTKIESGRIAIQHLDDSPCVAYPGLGVGCISSTVTALDLRIAGPARAMMNSAAVPDIANDTSFAKVAAPDSLIESIQQKARTRGEKPEVPVGMQLIETSSGYRLIPED